MVLVASGTAHEAILKPRLLSGERLPSDSGVSEPRLLRLQENPPVHPPPAGVHAGAVLLITAEPTRGQEPVAGDLVSLEQPWGALKCPPPWPLGVASWNRRNSSTANLSDRFVFLVGIDPQHSLKNSPVL